MIPRILFLGVLAATLVVGAATAAEEQDQGKPELKELESVDALREQFNEDSGKRRLLLLLSPT